LKVLAATLKVLGATLKVLEATLEVLGATLKVLEATLKVLGAKRVTRSNFHTDDPKISFVACHNSDARAS
jgi:hypothetical protein